MINVHQIYFDDQSWRNCDPAWTRYDNTDKLTEFFENSVIAELIEKGEHRKEKYFAVFSHRIKENVSFKEEGVRFNSITLERIVEKHNYDVYSFHKRREAINIATQAEHAHKGITKMFEKVLEHCGYTLPGKLQKIILFNAMVCTGDFWQAYYDDMLKPAMECLKEMPEAYKDSNYHSLIRKKEKGWTERFKRAFGVPYYPYHPFICERLASIYLQHNKQWTFKQIF